jgi:hypothetical protein
MEPTRALAMTREGADEKDYENTKRPSAVFEPN